VVPSFSMSLDSFLPLQFIHLLVEVNVSKGSYTKIWLPGIALLGGARTFQRWGLVSRSLETPYWKR
jgi:hypothetical protein